MAFSNIGLQEPSTITKVVAAVTIARGSTTEYQEILCLGDPTSSGAIAQVSTSAPASGDAGLTVRQVGYTAPSTTVTVSGYVAPSTTVQVSSVGGTVTTQPNSTGWGIAAGFHFDSSGALQITGASASTQVSVSGYVAPSTTVSVAHMIGNSSAADYMPVRIVDSSGTGYLSPGLEYTDGSTTSTLAAPGISYQNGSNTTMRMAGISTPLPVQLRTGINAFASTSKVVNSTASSALYSLISSGASLKNCVYAYSITSTAVTPMEVKFCSSNSSGTWTVGLGSGSSGITGANLALPAPSRIFATGSGEPLNVILTSTGVNVRISVASFTE